MHQIPCPKNKKLKGIDSANVFKIKLEKELVRPLNDDLIGLFGLVIVETHN